MAWITWGDIIESAYKIRQRGAGYLLGKLRLSPQARTRATWNAQAQASANWWSIPAIRERWNERITGHAGTSYEPWLAQQYATQIPQCRILSIGCGNGSHEILLAQQPHVHSVTGIDLSPVKIAEAQQAAKDAAVSNVSFLAGDLFGMSLQGSHLGRSPLRCCRAPTFLAHQKTAPCRIGSMARDHGNNLQSSHRDRWRGYQTFRNTGWCVCWLRRCLPLRTTLRRHQQEAALNH